MREHSPHSAQFYTRQRNQVVHDAQAKLADDVHVAAEQEIKMFGDGTGQRVLDRNYRAVDRPPLHPVEDLERTRARHHLRVRQHLFGRLVAERAKFSLNCDSHPPSSSRLRRVETGLGISGDAASCVFTGDMAAAAPALLPLPERPSGSNSSPRRFFPRSIPSACRSELRLHYSLAFPARPRPPPPALTSLPPRVGQLRIKAGLVNPPQRIKIGLLELSDSERHAAIVNGIVAESPRG